MPLYVKIESSLHARQIFQIVAEEVQLSEGQPRANPYGTLIGISELASEKYTELVKSKNSSLLMEFFESEQINTQRQEGHLILDRSNASISADGRDSIFAINLLVGCFTVIASTAKV